MYPPPWKACEELWDTPFSDMRVSCVSSCVVPTEATLSSSKPFTLAVAGTFFFPASPSLSLSSEEDEEEEDEEDPEEQDEDEEDELDPDRDEEEEEEDEEEEERDEELEEEPSESVSESPCAPRLASLRASLLALLLAFFSFLSAEFGVRGLVRAATICLSLSKTGFSSRPVGVAGG